ncbi:MAG: helix-turn-helix transcriptional regulator [Lutibacter sp.]
MDLGKAIKAIRKNKGFKQGNFCEKLGITQSYLSSIENNKKKPSVEVLEKIAETVGMPISILFWFTVTEEDVDKTKLEMFKLLKPSIDKLVTELF